MQRQEIPNNTPEQVRAYINEALDVLEEFDPPADLRASVFEKAVDLSASKQIVMTQPQPMNLPNLNHPFGRG